MTLKPKYLCFLLLLSGSFLKAQTETALYTRSLGTLENGWYEMTIPSEMYRHVHANFSDLRVVGTTAGGDTAEAPYLIRSSWMENKVENYPFTILNQSQSEGYNFFTLALESPQTINQIRLQFGNSNYNWLARLEGSNDQKEWFTLLDDYRLLSIQNPWTDYDFNRLNFSPALYQYFRLRLPQGTNPILQEAQITRNEVEERRLEKVKIIRNKQQEYKEQQQSELSFSLPEAMPISSLQLAVADTFQFYRALRIEYLDDSTETPQGWKYHYQSLYNGPLDSRETLLFDFNPIIAKDFRVLVNNEDNPTLKFLAPIASGPTYSLVCRISESANYSLFYGSPQPSKPSYDIERFKQDIPSNLGVLNLGEEQNIERSIAPKKEAFLDEPIYLWVIIIAIMGLLLFFSLKMLKKPAE